MEAEVNNLRAMPKQRVGNLTQDIKSHIGHVCQHDTFSKCIHIDSQPTPDFSMESISENSAEIQARTHTHNDRLNHWFSYFLCLIILNFLRQNKLIEHYIYLHRESHHKHIIIIIKYNVVCQFPAVAAIRLDESS